MSMAFKKRRRVRPDGFTPDATCGTNRTLTPAMIRELKKKGVKIENGKIVEEVKLRDETLAGFGPDHGCGSDNHVNDLEDLLDKNGGLKPRPQPLDPRVGGVKKKIR